MSFLNGLFTSLHGRALGLFKNVVAYGDAWLGGDNFQGVLWGSTDSLTALAGGGQTGATPITTAMARFTTVATGGDSALLPVSQPGMTITVSNAAAANSMNVFPASGEKINALSANAAFAVAAGKTAEFVCYTAGQWHTILSA
jgi:hypothetical protein